MFFFIKLLLLRHVFQYIKYTNNAWPCYVLSVARLLDEGHEVIGNECVDSACRQFFEENNIPYTCQDLPGGKGVVYKVNNFYVLFDTFSMQTMLCGYIHVCRSTMYLDDVLFCFGILWKSIIQFQATDGTPIKLYRCDCFDLTRYQLKYILIYRYVRV